MTEAEWLACDDSEKMLASLRGKVTARKLALFGVACCGAATRSVPGWAGLPAFWHPALTAVARWVDGLGSREEVDAFHEQADGYCDRVMGAIEHNLAVALWQLTSPDPVEWCHVAGAVQLGVRDLEGDEVAAAVSHSQTAYLRDIIGNSFRPVSLSIGLRTSTVMAVAQPIYDDRSFERLPILADALEDAGCTDADLLDHLRGPGPHVRGCWALDLILGKE
jgi:hypothetical protein